MLLFKVELIFRMFEFNDSSGKCATYSSSNLSSCCRTPSYQQTNKINQSSIKKQQEKPSQHMKFNFNPQSNAFSGIVRPLFAPRTETSAVKSKHFLTSGVHVFSLPIRRIRGLATALNKQTSCGYIIETVGKILEEVQIVPTSHCGVSFRLEEHNSRANSNHLRCYFVDMENIKPEIYYNGIYRCVGKYSVQHGIFQCYSITPCDDTDLQLQEVFQMHSDNVIAQMLSRN